MISRNVVVLLLPLFAVRLDAQAKARGGASVQPPIIELRRGLIITSSVRIAPKVYRLPAPSSLDSAVIVVRGDDVTVDFGGATMEGATEYDHILSPRRDSCNFDRVLQCLGTRIREIE